MVLRGLRLLLRVLGRKWDGRGAVWESRRAGAEWGFVGVRKDETMSGSGTWR